MGVLLCCLGVGGVQLAALLLVLTGIVGVWALLFALARCDLAGASFHALFQFQLMGLYGAF
ncbi:hypothetical protein, partial [Pseudomonas syringae group genomosp. 7]|uniref:hypothetical protein n=1 Tax=Pseudomonas syringae group genomosp. 7 TaxID=251699 RepID=UPI003770518E